MARSNESGFWRVQSEITVPLVGDRPWHNEKYAIVVKLSGGEQDDTTYCQ